MYSSTTFSNILLSHGLGLPRQAVARAHLPLYLAHRPKIKVGQHIASFPFALVYRGAGLWRDSQINGKCVYRFNRRDVLVPSVIERLRAQFRGDWYLI